MGRRYVVIKHPRCSAAAVLLSVCFVFSGDGDPRPLGSQKPPLSSDVTVLPTATGFALHESPQAGHLLSILLPSSVDPDHRLSVCWSWVYSVE